MRTNLLLFFMAGLLCLSIYSCETAVVADVTPGLDMDAIRADIQAMEDAYAAASMARDAEGVIVYYAEDAVSLAEGEPMIVGRDAILANMQENMAADSTGGGSVSFSVVDIFADGDLVVEVGTSTSTDEDGEVETGKFISVFQKQEDGSYLCIRDIWNSDSDDDDDDEDDEMMEEEDEMDE